MSYETIDTITLAELEEMKNKLHYLDRCTANEQRVLLEVIENIGKKQYFNAFRNIAELVSLATYNLQSLINDEERK